MSKSTEDFVDDYTSWVFERLNKADEYERRIAELEQLVDAVLAVEHKRGGSLNCFGEFIYKAPERIFLLAETLKGGDA